MKWQVNYTKSFFTRAYWTKTVFTSENILMHALYSITWHRHKTITILKEYYFMLVPFTLCSTKTIFKPYTNKTIFLYKHNKYEKLLFANYSVCI